MECGISPNHTRWQQGKLTKRENASLNSETCSSVRESACPKHRCQLSKSSFKAARPSAAVSAAGFPRKLEAGQETDHVGLCVEVVRKCSVGGSAGWGCRRLRGLSYACLAVVAGEDDGQDDLNGNSVHLRLGWGLISTDGGVLRKRSARNGGPPFTLLEALSRDLCQARHLTKAQSCEAGLALSAVLQCVHCQLEATSPALGRRPPVPTGIGQAGTGLRHPQQARGAPSNPNHSLHVNNMRCDARTRKRPKGRTIA